MRRLVSAAVLLLLFRLDSAAGVQSFGVDRPLPEATEFLERVRRNVARQYDDAILLNGYTYHVKSTRDNLTDKGALKDRRIEESDVINKDGLPLYKLVSKDGKPLSDKDAAKQEYEPLRRGPFNRPKSGPEAIEEAQRSSTICSASWTLKRCAAKMYGIVPRSLSNFLRRRMPKLGRAPER
jgi:hypothetical protein